mmetsp:Transcript_9080/g.15350  ORF Transcript_9080/g.15350 Transcript_9080/m.15350 type:complete len:1216 (+) Transcript_9080:81-3728(+)
MSKSSKRYRSRSRSRSGDRRDKEKKRHRRDDRDDEGTRSRSDRERDRDRHRERDREKRKSKYHDDHDHDKDRGRDRDRDRERARGRDSRDKETDKDRNGADKKANEEKGSVGSTTASSVSSVAAMISEKALHAAKTKEAQEMEKKKQEAEVQRRRRERLQAWRQSQPTTASEDAPPLKTEPPTSGAISNKSASEITTTASRALSPDSSCNRDSLKPIVPMTLVGSKRTQLISGAPKLAAAFGVDDDSTETEPPLKEHGVPRDLNQSMFSIHEDDANVVRHDTDDHENDDDYDPLDAFMTSLYDKGDVTEQYNDEEESSVGQNNKSTTHRPGAGQLSINPNGTNFITLEQITGRKKRNVNKTDGDSESVTSQVYDPADWKSDISFSPAPKMVDEEKEEQERRDFLEALRDSTVPGESSLPSSSAPVTSLSEGRGVSSSSPEGVSSKETLGRIFAGEGDMIEESEVEAKKKSALDILEEQKRGKELRAVDHSSVQYESFRKNLYIVPRILASLSAEELRMKRDLLQLKVRGKGCPAPVETWDQCGLSERMLSVIKKHNFEAPFSIQKQALPAIMCGRDIIAVAKTGSGKTLAFLLPMFRHILDQPPLRDSEGPIGIIMAPARELAYQIYNEAKKFTKALGLSVACVYGGAGVADQIADLKRGADIVVCTPGRMIDILCMQAGKLVSLKRVTMVVMDEADRMFDMGFEPQIKMILQNVRPDRQTVLFSATFPKQIEKLAKSILQYPLEIVVGERSTANKDITQYVEVHEPEDKYMRLLQLLGVWYERGSVLIFVDKQETCDQLFQDLLKSGYPCVSLHGGKDQLDRDHTLHEFKSGVMTVMVATSVAGRGLDVPEIVCVINYHCPNHMEDYVHRVGRTGRAGRKGTAYTFITPSEEQYAPTMLTILEKAGVTGDDVPMELKQMASTFKEKVKRGEAHWSSNGFSGSKGFSFDSSEMNEAQKLASMQKRAYEIEQGIISDKPEDNVDANDDFYEQEGEGEVDAPVSSNPSSVNLTGTVPQAPAHDTSGTALVLHESEVNNQDVVVGASPQLAALEKVRALAVSMGLNNAPSAPPPPAGQAMMTADGKVDTNAALQRAKMIALQMSGGVAGAEEPEEQMHFSEELEINDYPANVRRKVTQRSVLDEVTDRTGTNIISRGVYVPPGKKLEMGERKLFLLIEGPTEMQVKQAKIEVVRMLEEETLRQGASGQMSYSGRYSVT